MGKRSNFKRRPRDIYDTPYEAVAPLMAHLKHAVNYNWRFCEPCAGKGELIKHLEMYGMECGRASDIKPRALVVNGTKIKKIDALKLTNKDLGVSRFIITNPPWDRKILHPLIERFRVRAQTWILLDADWKETKQSSPFMKYCHAVVPIGRVKWIKGSKFTGKENCAWYLFKAWEPPHGTIFYPRES